LPTFEKKLKENYWISIHGSSRSPNIIMEGCFNFFGYHMYLVEKYLAKASNEYLPLGYTAKISFE
jgi:hypothetical protein